MILDFEIIMELLGGLLQEGQRSGLPAGRVYGGPEVKGLQDKEVLPEGEAAVVPPGPGPNYFIEKV